MNPSPGQIFYMYVSHRIKLLVKVPSNARFCHKVDLSFTNFPIMLLAKLAFTGLLFTKPFLNTLRKSSKDPKPSHTIHFYLLPPPLKVFALKT